jgi:hypothetical protein
LRDCRVKYTKCDVVALFITTQLSGFFDFN